MTPATRARIGRWALRTALVLAAGWGGLAIYYALAGNALVRAGWVASWCAMAVAALWGVRRGRENWALVGIFSAAFVVLAVSWWLMQPSQDRDWADDVAQRLQPQVHGDIVTLHNVRNFDWRSETDYVPRWETRQYDLNRLVSADLALSYWMGPAIAHTLVSFGFDDGSHVVFSLEIRKERGEAFSALGGFFRSFEETLVAADERDILRVRTNVRGEDMYLYRLAIPKAGCAACSWDMWNWPTNSIASRRSTTRLPATAPPLCSRWCGNCSPHCRWIIACCCPAMSTNTPTTITA